MPTRGHNHGEYSPEKESELRVVLTAIVLFRKNFAKLEISTVELRETLAELPRSTEALNRSKRKTISVLDRFVEEYKTAQRLATEAERILKGFFD